MVTTNVPTEMLVVYNGNEFRIGNRVRVLMKDKGEYIGKISHILSEMFIIETETGMPQKMIDVKEVDKMRLALPKESFDDPGFFYYDDDEREFWKTHWITINGIEERSV